MTIEAMEAAAPPEPGAAAPREPRIAAETPNDPEEVSRLVEEILRRLDELERRAGGQAGGRQAGELAAALRLWRRHGSLRLLDPVLIGLIRIYDGVACRGAAWREAPFGELCAAQLLEHWDALGHELQGLLEFYEVTPYRGVGDRFEPETQLLVRLEPTEDPGRVGRIAARLRPGFLHEKRIIRRERVAVFSNPRLPDWISGQS